jgi:2-methylfumaryl-CoA isomerase
VMVVALTTRHWRELLAVTGLGPAVEALAQILHADFSTEDDRFRYRELIAGLVSPWFEDRRLTDVEPAMGSTTLLWSTYRTFAELVGELRPELEANPMMAEIDQPGIGRLLAPGSPLRFGQSAQVPVRPAPALGGDTDTVLGELLGLSTNEVAELHRARVLEAGV